MSRSLHVFIPLTLSAQDVKSHIQGLQGKIADIPPEFISQLYLFSMCKPNSRIVFNQKMKFGIPSAVLGAAVC